MTIQTQYRVVGGKKKGLSEKQIENQILSWLKMKGILAMKIKTIGTFDQKLGRFRTPSPWYRKGVSDILCCYKGKFVGLEVKTQIGKLSLHQKIFIQDVKEAMGFAFVVRSVEDVAKAFEEIDRS